MALHTGALFSSYEEFQAVLKKHEHECGVRYIKGSSKKMRKESPYSETLQYEYVKFDCKQGPRTKESTCQGIRPNQSTVKTGCHATIRLMNDRATCKLKVSTCHLVHDSHAAGQEIKDELLIQCVQKYSILYDKSHPKFRYKDLTQKAWEEVAADLDEKVDVVKKRWNYLRVYFRGQRKLFESLKSKESSATKKKWPLYDSMTVLFPHEEFGNTTASDGVSETNQSFDSSDDVTEESVSVTFDNQLVDNVKIQPDVYLCQQPSRKRTMNEVDHQFFSAPKEQHREEDDNEHFLKSLLPLMRTLDSLAAMEFRHEVQGLLIRYIKKVHMQDMPSQSSGNRP